MRADVHGVKPRARRRALAVALPAIEKQFDTDVGTVQWVINAYALTFGVLIVVGGRLADIFGRKRIFILGAVVFACFSVLGGAPQDSAWLIACRALMGIGGAMMWPAILGMTFAALPQSRAGLAGGLILGAAEIGNAVGPMFGGVLTDALSWRWIFFVNVPIAAFGVLATWLAIHQKEPQPTDRRIDYGGVATLSIGLVSCWASASGCSTRRSRPPALRRSTPRGRGSREASSTCSRSPEARSGSA
jgi:MFS family permease